MPQYNKAVAKARYVQLMTAGDTIHQAEELYYLANGKYTNNLDDLDITIDHSNYQLALDVQAGGHAAINAVSNKWGIGHIVYFDKHYGGNAQSGRRECRVYNTDSDYMHGVCQSLTGNTATAVGSYTLYVFK